MTNKAKAIQTLYRAGRITKEGVRQAVEKNIITKDEYYKITGEYYVEPEVEPEITTEVPEQIDPETEEENIE